MGVNGGDSGFISKSAPTETCQGLPINPGRITFVPSRLYNQCSTIFLACVLRSPQKLGEGTKLLTSSAQGPPSQLNPHVLSPRSILILILWLNSLEECYLSGLRKTTKHSGRREDSRRRLTGVKTVGNLHLEEIFCLEESSVLRNSSKLLS